MNRVVTAAVLLLASCGGTRPSEKSAFRFSEPIIAIEPPNSGGVFRFAGCTNRIADPPVVRRLRVTRATGALECAWKQASGVSIRQEWQYGSAPSGSALDGPCRPLQAGVPYTIAATGSGWGSLQFSIDEAGRAAVQDSACTLAVDFER